MPSSPTKDSSSLTSIATSTGTEQSTPAGLIKAKNRQLSRDNTIRRKHGSTSSKPKQPLGPAGALLAKMPVKPGTVMSMFPSEPLIMAEADSVVQVARAMAGKRTDAVLIVNNRSESKLTGIVTDKDLAYRCVAEGMDAARTPVSTIMTPSPVHVRSDAQVDEAMNLMLNNHFRHLPVVDDLKIVALLDITKIMQLIQNKIQSTWGKARELKSAFSDFKNSWSNFTVTSEVNEWFEDWASKMVEPDLASVIDNTVMMPEVQFKTTVKDAARIMKETRRTAVIVTGPTQGQELAGIFTTKDICLRILANDVDSKSTSVVRVMTPHPDYALESMTIQDALKMMHDNHYLHLPVKNERGSVVGLVDVLELTYQTMDVLIKQQSLLPALTGEGGTDSNLGGRGELSKSTEFAERNFPGPMWSQFWDSNGLNSAAVEHQNQLVGASGAEASHSHTSSVRFGGMVGLSSESGLQPARERSIGRMSETAESNNTTVHVTNFPFKFRDPFTASIHRCILDENNIAKTDLSVEDVILTRLLETVVSKCGCETVLPKKEAVEFYKKNHFVNCRHKDLQRARVDNNQYDANLYDDERYLDETAMTPVPNESVALEVQIGILYKDEEGDSVVIASDSDVLDAINIARTMSWTRVALTISATYEDEITGTRKPISDLPIFANNSGGAESSKILGSLLDAEDSMENLFHVGSGPSDEKLVIPLNLAVGIVGGIAIAAFAIARLFK